MAHIDTRNLKPDRNGKPRKTYLVRWVDAAHKERAKSFPRMVAAKAFKVEIERSLMLGTYIDPRAGDTTFGAYAQRWRTGRIDHRPATAARVKQYLECYAYDRIGALRMGAARRADLQSWVRVLVHTDGLAPSTVRGVVAVVSTVFSHAVDEGVIARNPCTGLALPELPRTEVMIPTTEQLIEILDALRVPTYRRLVLVAAGSGLRAGELRGLTEDRVDWLRRTIKVDRQLAARAPIWGPPKTAAGHRVVPVAQSVIDVLAAQIAQRGTGPGGLIFTNRSHECVKQPALNRALARALAPLGWPDGTGLHVFRHYYASLLIHAGLSVKVVQRRLGHATSRETLDTYGHLWPDDDEDSRTAVADVLGPIISGAAAGPSQVRESVKPTSLHRRSLAQKQRQSDSGGQLAGGAGS